MMKFKVGDTVKVLAGKDKGREGKIEKIYPKKGWALIPGVNIFKKHVKSQPGQKGGIFDVPRPLPFAKMGIVCPSCKKVTRVGIKMVGDEKIRFCKKCKKEISNKK